MERRLAVRNHLAAVAEARHFIERALATLPDEQRETAVLLVSEVVTNAVLHAGGSISLLLCERDGDVRVEVSDGSSSVPQRRLASSDATSGRGIELVEMLAAAWGVRQDDSGKTVWFTLESEHAGDEGERELTSRVPGLGVAWRMRSATRRGSVTSVRNLALV